MAQVPSLYSMRLGQQQTAAPSDLGTFTQQLLQEMRQRMQQASERVAARMAAAAEQVDALEHDLLGLVEPARRRPQP